MKYVFVLLIFLASCSLTQERTNRSISSIEDSSCTELFREFLSYSGQQRFRIDVDQVYDEIRRLDEIFPGELQTKIVGRYEGDPIYRIDMPGIGDGPKKRVIITAGVHGNESVGVSTVLKVIHQIVNDTSIREAFDVVFFPALNPAGLRRSSRYLSNNVDLNRTFKSGKEEEVTNILKDSLRGESFELALDLHEAATKKGFFVIKADKNDDELTLNALSVVSDEYKLQSPDGNYPYNIGQIKDPRKTAYVLYSPGETSSLSSGTLKGYFKEELSAQYAYTLESPGTLDLVKRQEIYIELVKSFLRTYQSR